MAIGPTPTYPGSSIWSPHPKSKASQKNATQEDLAQSNSGVNEAIARNQQTISDAQHEADADLQHIRDGYEQSEMAETTSQEDALAKQRLKGYEQLRDLKRQQEAEMNRVRREGEKSLKSAQDYYRDTLYNSTRQGEETLQETKNKQSREMQFASSTGQADLEAQKNDERRKIEELKHTQETQFTQISGNARKEHKRMQETTQLALEQDNQKFEKQFTSAVAENQREIDSLDNLGNQQIRQIRQDTAQKLSAYSSRQNDPFYKMVDLKAELRDEGDKFVLRANIPSHEQDHVRVGLKGNVLVLSGARRNEEKLELGPGRSKGTSSYQSFEESFPLSAAVDRNRLSKEFHGDTVTITIPKANPLFYHEAYQARSTPDRVRAERPQFPGNLLGPETAQKENPEPSKKTPGSRTLT